MSIYMTLDGRLFWSHGILSLGNMQIKEVKTKTFLLT